MRTHYIVISLSLAATLTACNRQDATTAVAAKSAATPAADLTAAPQPYQRMRFVSAIEQSQASQARRLQPVRRGSHAAASQAVATTPRVALAALSAIAPTSVATSAMPTATIAVASTQAAPPMASPAEEMIGDHSHGSGLIGNVVIRGGMGPNGKCDPRSDAQAAGMLAGRPNSSMPLMPSSSVFGRR